jgi:hypothetical protein
VRALPQGGDDSLRPRTFYSDPIIEVRDRYKQMGLSARQWVALQARTRSPQYMIRQGFSGSWTWRADWVNYAFYKVLLNDTWVPEVRAGARDDCEAREHNPDSGVLECAAMHAARPHRAAR